MSEGHEQKFYDAPGAPIFEALEVSPRNVALIVGEQRQLAAIATLSNGDTQDVTASADWSSADAEIASVSGAGLVEGAGNGSTVITARLGPLSGGASVSVSGGSSDDGWWRIL